MLEKLCQRGCRTFNLSSKAENLLRSSADQYLPPECQKDETLFGHLVCQIIRALAAHRKLSPPPDFQIRRCRPRFKRKIFKIQPIAYVVIGGNRFRIAVDNNGLFFMAF